jgi:hypothetical protein
MLLQNRSSSRDEVDRLWILALNSIEHKFQPKINPRDLAVRFPVDSEPMSRGQSNHNATDGAVEPGSRPKSVR